MENTVSSEKFLWLKSIGAVDLGKPVRYIFSFSGAGADFLLSEQDLNDLTLDELKQRYERAKKTALSILERKDEKGKIVV